MQEYLSITVSRKSSESFAAESRVAKAEDNLASAYEQFLSAVDRGDDSAILDAYKQVGELTREAVAFQQQSLALQKLHQDEYFLQFASIGSSVEQTDQIYGPGTDVEIGNNPGEMWREYHVGDFIIGVSFLNGTSAAEIISKADKSEINESEMKAIINGSGPLSQWKGPITIQPDGVGYANAERQYIFAYSSGQRTAILDTLSYFRQEQALQADGEESQIDAWERLNDTGNGTHRSILEQDVTGAIGQ